MTNTKDPDQMDGYDIADLVIEMFTNLCSEDVGHKTIVTSDRIVVAVEALPEDYPKLIGSKGVIYEAIKTYARALSTKYNYRIEILLSEML